MNTLYLDLSMGAAGDMLCAALLELCPDPAEAVAALNALGIPGVQLRLEPREKCGVQGSHFAVTVNGTEERPDEPLPEHHHHSSLGDIRAIIQALPLEMPVMADALAVYDLLAGAEAKAHGKPMELIHFHEVGSLDAVADVVSCCWLMHALRPERVAASPVATGSGTVRCAHGILPVPAPATTALLTGIPVTPGDYEKELCTPTGAALVRHFVQEFGPMPAMTAERIGYGMGTRDFPRANCIRAVLGESEATDEIIELCCNVDDMTPEAVGFAMQTLLDAGAPEVWTTPVGMKKNRPGILLTCLCRREQRDEMVRLILRHTSTIGVRETVCRRYILRRGSGTVETPFGPVRVKRSAGYGVEREKAEYDDLARIAREHGLTLDEVRAIVKSGE